MSDAAGAGAAVASVVARCHCIRCSVVAVFVAVATAVAVAVADVFAVAGNLALLLESLRCGAREAPSHFWFCLCSLVFDCQLRLVGLKVECHLG